MQSQFEIGGGNGSGLHETTLRLVETGDVIKINEVCLNLKEEGRTSLLSFHFYCKI